MKLTHNVLPNGHTFHHNGRKYHVVLNFRDNGDFLYVVKWYARTEKEWKYECWSAFDYDTTIRKLSIEKLII